MSTNRISPFLSRQRLTLVPMMVVPIRLVRDLWAYYENWRAASRIFDNSVVEPSKEHHPVDNIPLYDAATRNTQGV
ncbi:MAG: hypothetical protein RML40_02735 [Bacteroidota bacterium]|nr:hypothetical protein [Candidatus Kapabacteria bacterium]MDW8219427.1 hypothetical protein [Bacteroidota bacterium]